MWCTFSCRPSTVEFSSVSDKWPCHCRSESPTVCDVPPRSVVNLHLFWSYSSVQNCISESLTYCLPCRLGDRKGIRPVKKSWVLVCWWWRFDWSFARLIAPVVTTSIILSSNKSRMETCWCKCLLLRVVAAATSIISCCSKVQNALTFWYRLIHNRAYKQSHPPNGCLSISPQCFNERIASVLSVKSHPSFCWSENVSDCPAAAVYAWYVYYKSAKEVFL